MAKFCDIEKFKKTYKHKIGTQFDNAINEMEREKFCVDDVVEMSEYIESQKEVMRLRDLSHKVNQDAMQYEEMYRELQHKVNKTISEMKEEYDNFKYNTNKTLGASFGIRKAIEILEKNIGE